MASWHRKFPKAFWAFLLALFLSGGLALFHTLKPYAEFASPLPQDPAVKVYFNHNQAEHYQDPYRNFTRQGDNLEQQIIDAINRAQSTVDIAVMEFRLPKVAQALVAKHNSGVRVRLIIDNKYNQAVSDYTPAEMARMNQHDKQAFEELQRYPADALALLRENGIEVKDDTASGTTKGSGLMHHKFVVVDGKTTIISSGNLTTSEMHGDFNSPESRGNPNNMVVLADNPQIAKVFTDEFNYMWQGVFKSHKPYRPPVTIPVGKGTITINFSPASRNQDIAATSNGIIAYFVQQARHSVHIALFVFSDQNISDTLSEVSDRGAGDIKILIDPDFYARPYSKAYDAMGVCPHSGKKHSLIQVKPWHHPIATVGYPTAPSGDRGVHSKMAILDGTMVIAGSQNWSKSANYLNDETLVAIQNPTVAAHYEREFSRLYATAVVGLSSLPHAQQCRNNSSSQEPTPTLELEPSESNI